MRVEEKKKIYLMIIYINWHFFDNWWSCSSKIPYLLYSIHIYKTSCGSFVNPIEHPTNIIRDHVRDKIRDDEYHIKRVYTRSSSS